MSRNPKKNLETGEEILGDSIAPEAADAPAETQPEFPAEPEAPAEVKQYVVMGGPRQITHAGMPMTLPHGKVVSSHVANIDELRRQGVVLEEVK